MPYVRRSSIVLPRYMNEVDMIILWSVLAAVLLLMSEVSLYAAANNILLQSWSAAYSDLSGLTVFLGLVIFIMVRLIKTAEDNFNKVLIIPTIGILFCIFYILMPFRT